MFKIGDLIKGTQGAPYCITNEKMLVGVVKEARMVRFAAVKRKL